MTTPVQPLISVIIPVYNGARYLAETIESVLAQDYRPLEVLVIDDGSTDTTAAVAQRFAPHVTYSFQTQQGPNAARNRGIQQATGEYIAFLDADDLWMPGKLSLQSAALAADPQLDAVFGLLQQFYSPDADDTLRASYHVGAEIVPGYSYSTLLIRAHVLRRIGTFDEQSYIGEFLEWLSRARDLHLQDRLEPEILTKRRIHGTNLTIRHKANLATGYLHAIKATLDRRRIHANASPSPEPHPERDR